MIRWIGGVIEVDPGLVKIAEFAEKSRGAYNGRAWKETGRIRLVLGSSKWFPAPSRIYPGRKSEAYRDPKYRNRTDALVGITAHEMMHLDPVRGRGERWTTWAEHAVMARYLPERDRLLKEWRDNSAR